MRFLNVSLYPCNHKKRKQRLIILRVSNNILREFLPFSVHSLCWMQDVKSTQNIRTLEGMF